MKEAGEMTGSALFIEFDSEEALNTWLETAPYVTCAWGDVKVKPVRLLP